MLSLERCRQLLGSPELDHQQLTDLRDQLYSLASLALDQYSASLTSSERPEDTPTFATALDLIPAEERDEVIERAALREYYGGHDRTTAEKLAVMEKLNAAKKKIAPRKRRGASE